MPSRGKKPCAWCKSRRGPWEKCWSCGGSGLDEQCESLSPIYKFDEGSRRCRGKRGHTGRHHAKTSDGASVSPAHDYEVVWE